MSMNKLKLGCGSVISVLAAKLPFFNYVMAQQLFKGWPSKTSSVKRLLHNWPTSRKKLAYGSPARFMQIPVPPLATSLPSHNLKWLGLVTTTRSRPRTMVLISCWIIAIFGYGHRVPTQLCGFATRSFEPFMSSSMTAVLLRLTRRFWPVPLLKGRLNYSKLITLVRTPIYHNPASYTVKLAQWRSAKSSRLDQLFGPKNPRLVAT